MFGDPQGTPASLGTGNPVTSTPGSAAWQASGQAGSTGSYGWYLICNDSSFPALSGGVTIECWFNATFYGSATAWTVDGNTGSPSNSPVTAQPYNSPVTIWEIATSSAPSLPPPARRLRAPEPASRRAPATASTPPRTCAVDSWHMVTVTLTTTAWQVWLDGGANATVSGSASMTSAWTYFIANGDFGSSAGAAAPASLVHGGNISLSHIAVYPYQSARITGSWITTGRRSPRSGSFPRPPGCRSPGPTGRSRSSAEFAQRPTSDFYVPDGSAGGSFGRLQRRDGHRHLRRRGSHGPRRVTSGPSAWAGEHDFVLRECRRGLPITTSSRGSPGPGWPRCSMSTPARISAPKPNPPWSTGTATRSPGVTAGAPPGRASPRYPGGTAPPRPRRPSAIGDTVGQRIERLMRAGRTTSPNRCIDPAPLLVQAPGAVRRRRPGRRGDPGDPAESDSGCLSVDNLNHLIYWQSSHLASQYSSPVWTLGPDTGSGQTPYYPEIRWVTDPQRVCNAISDHARCPRPGPPCRRSPRRTPRRWTPRRTQYGAQPLAVTSWLQSVSRDAVPGQLAVQQLRHAAEARREGQDRRGTLPGRVGSGHGRQHRRRRHARGLANRRRRDRSYVPGH